MKRIFNRNSSTFIFEASFPYFHPKTILKTTHHATSTHRFQFGDIPAKIFGNVHHLVDDAINFLRTQSAMMKKRVELQVTRRSITRCNLFSTPCNHFAEATNEIVVRGTISFSDFGSLRDWEYPKTLRGKTSNFDIAIQE